MIATPPMKGMVTRGNPTNLPEAQKLGAAANSDRAERKAREIAAALTDAGADGSWTANDVVGMLNGRGLLTSRDGLWTVSSIRRPLTRAREILDETQPERKTEVGIIGWTNNGFQTGL